MDAGLNPLKLFLPPYQYNDSRCSGHFQQVQHRDRNQEITSTVCVNKTLQRCFFPDGANTILIITILIITILINDPIWMTPIFVVNEDAKRFVVIFAALRDDRCYRLKLGNCLPISYIGTLS